MAYPKHAGLVQKECGKINIAGIYKSSEIALPSLLNLKSHDPYLEWKESSSKPYATGHQLIAARPHF